MNCIPCMTLLVLSAVIAVSAQGKGPTVDSSQGARRDVLTVDEERRNAYLRNDADTLDRIFAPDVSIITGSGTLDDRAETIADVRSRALTYDTLTYDDTSVRLFGNTAIVTSRAAVSGQYKGVRLQYRLLVTRVYVRTHGRWSLEAIQSTRIPPS